MEYQKYEIKSGDLTEGQNEIIANFDLNSGIRASKPETYKSVTVGFHNGKCFHVCFKD